jgi:hypothetical protein
MECYVPPLRIIVLILVILSAGSITFLNQIFAFKPSNSIDSQFPDLPALDSLPDLNLSELSNFDLPSNGLPTSNTPSSLIPDIVGTYSSPDYGFQIDLPKDWKGKEIKFLANMVFAAPPDVDLSRFEVPGTFMIITSMTKETLEKLASITKPFAGAAAQNGLEIQGGGASQNVGSNPLDISSSLGSEYSCQPLPSSVVTINGIGTEVSSADCTNSQGTHAKTKSYTFVTGNDSLIVVNFLSNSTTAYDENLPLFEGSVKTIKISNPLDIATSETYKRFKELKSEFNQVGS